MFLDISNIGGENLVFEEAVSLPDLARQHPDVLDTPVLTVAGTVRPGPDPRKPAEGGQVGGEIRCRLRLRCSRCLEEVDLERLIPFELTLVNKFPQPSGPDHQVDRAETRFFEISAGKLDLSALAAEQIYLDLPAKPICRTHCAGLCPTCGNNRNLLECDCREQLTDPRLAALQVIRDKMDD